MARISLISPESATAEVKEIYEKTLRGKPGNAQKALAHRPEMLKNFLSFYASVGRSLDRKLYELIYLRVSLINGCHYCTQHHVASSKRVGFTAEDWSALRAGDYSRYSERERAALIYIEKLTRMPHDISDSDFAPLQPVFLRTGDCGHSSVDGPGESYQPVHRSPGAGSGVPRGKDLSGSGIAELNNCVIQDPNAAWTGFQITQLLNFSITKSLTGFPAHRRRAS